MGSKSEVLVVGSLSFDYLGAADGTLRSDSLVNSLSSLLQAPGGRGGNFAVFAQALGCDVRLVAPVGRNFGTSFYYKDLDERGVDLSRLWWSQALETQSVFLFTAGNDVRIYVFRERGDEWESAYCKWSVDAVVERRWDAVYCTSELSALNADVLRVAQSGIKVFSPGPDVHRDSRAHLRSCLSAANVVLLSQSEMDVVDAALANAISAFGCHTVWVVTRGGEGSAVHYEGEVTQMPVAAANAVVDPIGAGDAYAAGFVYELVSGSDVRQAAMTGSVVASFAIEAQGCQTVVPTLEEVDQRRVESYTFGGSTAFLS